MTMRSRMLVSAMAMLALAVAGSAQEAARQTPVEKSRTPRVTQRATPEPIDNADQVATPLNSDEAMRSAIVNLSTQINELTSEMKLLRRTTERNSQTIEL